MKRKIDPGYEGAVAEDFKIPPAGIEQIDRAVFELFDNRLSFEVKVKDQLEKVPVVFSTGERFALTRRDSPIRDKNNTLILPIISIHRTSIDHTPSQGGYGTPISYRDQQSYVVRKKLDHRDRDYQKIINKMGIRNQKNVASRNNFSSNNNFPGNIASPGSVASRRQGRNLSFLDDPKGNFLRKDIGNNIFEIITVPYPTFATMNFQVTFWTQYMQQMNQMIETMFSQFDGQDHGFAIKSKSGYEYVAYIKSPLNNADNFSDFSQDERIIKYSFDVTVPGYFIANNNPGTPSPFRKFYSAPQIEFGYIQSSTQVVKKSESVSDKEEQKKFLLSDVNTIDSIRDDDEMRGQGSERLTNIQENPFSGNREVSFVKVLTRNQRSGETVSRALITRNLQTTLDTSDD